MIRLFFIYFSIFSQCYNSWATSPDLGKLRVLEVDGGGIRGVYPAGVLNQIEESLEGKKIKDFFKGGMSGTSTGSFIVMALAAPKHKNTEGIFDDGPYTPREIGEFYEEMANRVFECWSPQNCWENCCDCPSSLCGIVSQIAYNIVTLGGCFGCCYNCWGYCGPKYSNKKLRDALEDRFGDMKLGDTLVPIQIVAYDIEHNKPIYFNSKDHPDMRMVDAGLASSAAPTFFPSVDVSDGESKYHCVDGGLVDNCSSIAALRFGMTNYSRDHPTDPVRHDDFLVVSIGTGSKLKSSKVDKLRRAGKIGWASDAVEISMDGTTEASHLNMTGFFEEVWRTRSIRKYFRFQIKLNESESKMDDPKLVRVIRGKARTREDIVHSNPLYEDFESDYLTRGHPRPSRRAHVDRLRVIDDTRSISSAAGALLPFTSPVPSERTKITSSVMSAAAAAEPSATSHPLRHVGGADVLATNEVEIRDEAPPA
jgi:patatin-like phospholipase/acyl hydrolase